MRCLISINGMPPCAFPWCPPSCPGRGDGSFPMPKTTRPLCIDCRVEPPELNYKGTGYKKRCAECQRKKEKQSNTKQKREKRK